MERRSFLLALFGVAGSAALGSSLIRSAEATPLDQLRNLAPPEDELGADNADFDGEAPDGTPIEEVQNGPRRRQNRRSSRRTGRRTSRRVYRRHDRRYYGRRGRYWHNGRWWGGRRWVCRTRFDRWGRPFRSCFWTYW